jgi:hypothetical protein
LVSWKLAELMVCLEQVQKKLPSSEKLPNSKKLPSSEELSNSMKLLSSKELLSLEKLPSSTKLSRLLTVHFLCFNPLQTPTIYS